MYGPCSSSNSQAPPYSQPSSRSHSDSRDFSRSDRPVLDSRKKNTEPPSRKEMIEKVMADVPVLDIMRRPGHGTVGQPISLEVNYLAIGHNLPDHLYQYDVKIETVPPPKGRGQERRLITNKDKFVEIIRYFLKQNSADRLGVGTIAYDGRKMLYTRHRFYAEDSDDDDDEKNDYKGDNEQMQADGPKRKKRKKGGSIDFPVHYGPGGKPSPYQVIIKPVKGGHKLETAGLKQWLNGDPEPAGGGGGKYGDLRHVLQAFDVAARQSSSQRMIPHEASYYDDEDCIDTEDGAAVYYGLYQRLRACEMGFGLVVDLSASLFVKPQPLAHVLAQIYLTTESHRNGPGHGHSYGHGPWNVDDYRSTLEEMNDRGIPPSTRQAFEAVLNTFELELRGEFRERFQPRPGGKGRRRGGPWQMRTFKRGVYLTQEPASTEVIGKGYGRGSRRGTRGGRGGRGGDGCSPGRGGYSNHRGGGGTGMTVVQYLEEKYAPLRFEYPDLPCLNIAKNQSRTKRKILYPIESFVTVGNKTFRRYCREYPVVSVGHQRDLLRAMSMSPAARFEMVQKRVGKAEYGASDTMHGFGLEVGRDGGALAAAGFLRMDGRLLPAPALKCRAMAAGADGRGEEMVAIPAETVAEGEWPVEAFYHGGEVSAWAIVLSGLDQEDQRGPSRDDVLQRFSQKLTCKGIQMGMEWRNTGPYIVTAGEGKDEIEQAFVEVKRKFADHGDEIQADKNNRSLVIVVKPSIDPHHYAAIKEVGHRLCLMTQVILQGTLEHCTDPLLYSLLLKINVKMGGWNYIVDGELPCMGGGGAGGDCGGTGGTTMVLGMGVSHGDGRSVTSSPSSPSSSYATMACSTDQVLSQWATQACPQRHRVELIVHARQMMMELLEAYQQQQADGALPWRIIVQRGGISEGNYEACLSYELRAIREACVEYYTTAAGDHPLPKFTFMTIQDRHHTRFVPLDQQMADPSGNCKPGTVVDTNIVDPVGFDFFLLSHAGIQGTSVPRYYRILHDENGFTADEIQQFCYYVCCLSPHCSRSVKSPTPCQLASLAAERIRIIRDESANEKCDGTAVATKDGHEGGEYEPLIPKELLTRLFYI